MSGDIAGRTAHSDDRGVLREAVLSSLEKSSKKPRRLSRLWKSLTHRKARGSQEDPPAPLATTPPNAYAEASCTELSEDVFEPALVNGASNTNHSEAAIISHNDSHNGAVDPHPTATVGDNGVSTEAYRNEMVSEDVVVVEGGEIGTVHTQVDYVHYLVPDLQSIFSSAYYWGVMDRYEAEKLLETKPEGTFLLRDSAQEDFLFSVSFRRYNRSLHARIEQWEHKFSFDSHDSNVYSCKSVCSLIERYKDPSFLMFFEPMLTIPLPKTTPFSLMSLCRATLCSRLNYDHITRLPIPRCLMHYLQYYHYKQRVRVRRF